MKKNFKFNKESALIIVLAGILCLVAVWPMSGTSGKGKGGEQTPVMEEAVNVAASTVSAETALNIYIENQEARLTELLEQVDGAGKVQVMIRARASKEYVVEKDIITDNSTINEADSQGGTRQSNDTSRSEASVYTRDGNGNDIPLVIKEMEPEIEGVVVAAEGGGSERVVGEITQAVQVLFDVPVHKIKVVKMKGE